MSYPEMSSIAPRRRTSLMAQPRPKTAYDQVPENYHVSARPVTRMSMMPMKRNHDVLDWETFSHNQEEAGGEHALAEFADPFAHFPVDTNPGGPLQQRRYSNFTQSWKHGMSELRSLTRRMSLTVKSRGSRQREEMVEKRPQPLMPLRPGHNMTNSSEAIPTRPKSRGRLLRSLSTRRRPSLPLLNTHAMLDAQKDTVEPMPLTARGRGQPFLSDLVYGGAGARASAAAQNELFHASRTPPLPPYEPREGGENKAEQDAESGIGIVLDGRTRRGSSPVNAHVLCQDPTSVLATELMESILSFLDVESLTQVALVSQKWHDLCQSQAVWKGIFYREYGSKMAHPPPDFPLAAGLGKNTPGQDFRKLFQVRTLIDKRWRNGEAAAIYLNGHKDSVYCAQFDEHKIITGSRDNTIRVWDAHTYQCIRKLGPPNNTRERQAFVSPAVEPQGVLPFFKADISSPDPATVETGLWHQASVLCLQYDDETLVTGSSDFSCLVWSIKDNYQPLFRLIGHHAGVLDVCIDKHRIVTCSKDTTIKVWDRVTGRLIRTLVGHRGPVNAVQVRGNLLASASGDGMSKLWRLEDGVCIKEFQSKDRGLACVEFSENGRTIFAGGNDQVIYEYDTVTGGRVRELKGHRDLVRSLHLDTANSRIISGSYDHSIKVWNAVKGESAEDGGLQINFEGWTSSWILAAKSNYRKIVCTSQDGRVVIIDFGYGIDGVELVEA